MRCYKLHMSLSLVQRDFRKLRNALHLHHFTLDLSRELKGACACGKQAYARSLALTTKAPGTLTAGLVAASVGIWFIKRQRLNATDQTTSHSTHARSSITDLVQKFRRLRRSMLRS